MKNSVLSVVVSGGLAIGSLVGAGPALGSIEQPTVVSADPVNYTPNVVDDDVVAHTSVDALTQLGSTIYAGGRFHSVERAGATYTRNNLMSFDASTGKMTSFAPNLDGKVFALLATGDSLYVGGYFKTVGGVARRGLAKLDATTGALDTSFNARLRGAVQEIRMSGGRLLVGGKFPQRLLALNPATGDDTGYIDVPISGSVASTAGATDIYRFAVNPQGTRLVAIGNFTTVAGQRRWRAFMLNLGATSATLNPWHYQPLENDCRSQKSRAYLRDVDFSPDGSYFVMDSTGYVPLSGGLGRDICDAAARFETGIAAPNRPTWINYSGGDTFHSIAATGAAVYVQGHFRWLDNPNGRDAPGPGAQPRSGIGAIDPATGKALPWNPGKTRAVGGKDLLPTSEGLWVGSDGARFAGERRDNIAFVPLP
ncbi:MAG TPA: hypothetical protein VFJ14_09685 [Nocardioidaceae bacterium]|nr:hypothetical protein [Nocardioidaceae bacterium]